MTKTTNNARSAAYQDVRLGLDRTPEATRRYQADPHYAACVREARTILAMHLPDVSP